MNMSTITSLTVATSDDEKAEVGDRKTEVLGALSVSAPLIDRPLTREQAETLLAHDDGGYATVVVAADLWQMIAASGESFLGGDCDEFDYLHSLAYDHGLTHGSSARVVGVRPNDVLLVAYTTCLRDEDA